MSNPSVCSILDMPDEILVKIILYFDARERLALGNSCKKFNDLVFGDEELLRNLDFTHERRLTKESDIQKYFDDENTYQKILGINIENVGGIENLSSSIGKAINLVELKILDGLEFESVEELSRFLKPLAHLKRLSVNWPASLKWRSSNDPERCKVLEEPFSRLTYLFLKITWYSDKFLLTLQYCQQLEKLSLYVVNELRYGYLYEEFMKLSNLKLIQLRIQENMMRLKNDIMSIVPDPTEWTEFHPMALLSEIYLERNVEVCAELEQVKKAPPPSYIADLRVGPGLIEKGWSLFPEHLLSEVIRVTHEDAPAEFCCLSWSDNYSPDGKLSPLKIDEAKKLLKDPNYQISSLCLQHCIGKYCDVHLLASAFPNLTRLLLYAIRHHHNPPEKTKALRRCLRKKGSLVSEEHSDAWNTDSSFKILVENTPHLEVLEINRFPRVYWWKTGSLDALDQISGWKNLTVIRLDCVPMTSAKFLIDIGKECKKLEEVTLHDPSTFEGCCYENELLEMLQQCKNLRKLNIWSLHLECLSEMFNILSNRSRLVALHSSTMTKECDPGELTSSVEKMLRQCQELKQFSVELWKYRFCDELRPDVDRVISKLNRSDFQFCINEDFRDPCKSSNVFLSSPFMPLPHYG